MNKFLKITIIQSPNNEISYLLNCDQVVGMIPSGDDTVIELATGKNLHAAHRFEWFENQLTQDK